MLGLAVGGLLHVVDSDELADSDLANVVEDVLLIEVDGRNGSVGARSKI